MTDSRPATRLEYCFADRRSAVQASGQAHARERQQRSGGNLPRQQLRCSSVERQQFERGSNLLRQQVRRTVQTRRARRACRGRAPPRSPCRRAPPRSECRLGCVAGGWGCLRLWERAGQRPAAQHAARPAPRRATHSCACATTCRRCTKCSATCSSCAGAVGRRRAAAGWREAASV